MAAKIPRKKMRKIPKWVGGISGKNLERKNGGQKF